MAKVTSKLQVTLPKRIADKHGIVLRGCATDALSWFDAHLWAYAECFGISEIISEDFEHGRHFGRVRIFDPFAAASGQVRELPPLYEASG